MSRGDVILGGVGGFLGATVFGVSIGVVTGSLFWGWICFAIPAYIVLGLTKGRLDQFNKSKGEDNNG